MIELMGIKKGAIFDLDGTLLDSMGIWEEIDRKFLKKRGLDVPQDYLDIITPMGFLEAAEYTVKRFGFLDKPEALVEEWFAMAVYSYGHEIGLKPYAAQYLRSLKENGIKIAAATSSDNVLFLPALENNRIDQYFDCYVTTKEVERGKGFPDIYIEAADRLGLLPKDCVVFEDIYAGIAGAKAGGFYTVAVEERYSLADREKIKAEAERYIVDFSELL